MGHKGFRFFILIVFLMLVIALTITSYNLLQEKPKTDLISKPKAGFISGRSNAIIQLPKPGNTTSVIINFSKCSRGSETVYFGLGSTHFAFEGIKNFRCVFYYGTEIENPNWDGSLSYICEVPAYLGSRKYLVEDSGIRIDGLKRYCSKL